MPPPGTVLLDDDLGASSRASLPTSGLASPETAEYTEGAYVVRRASVENPQGGADQPEIIVPGFYVDASISVDVVMVNPSDDQYVNLGCRSQDEFSQYRFTVFPAGGEFAVVRWTGPTSGPFLIPLTPSAAIHRGNQTNHLELSCQGTLIEGTINGVPVASVVDNTFSSGQFWIGMGQAAATINPSGSTTSVGIIIEARYSNLVVTQR